MFAEKFDYVFLKLHMTCLGINTPSDFFKKSSIKLSYTDKIS